LQVRQQKPKIFKNFPFTIECLDATVEACLTDIPGPSIECSGGGVKPKLQTSFFSRELFTHDMDFFDLCDHFTDPKDMHVIFTSNVGTNISEMITLILDPENVNI
jgi:hypothetical protein